MGRLDGNVVIVTGAARGIGKGIARRLAREGAAIVVADIDDDRGRAAADEIESELKGSAVYRHADVGDEQDARSLIDWSAEKFGRIDVLVNNAQAISGLHRLEDTTNAEFETVLRTGPWATFWMMKAVLPYMRENHGGSIINFVSLTGVRGIEMMGDYAAAKEAIGGLSRTAAREWGRYAVRVNCIAPVAQNETDAPGRQRDPDRYAQYLARIPLGHKGDQEEEIAGAALFLASEDSKFVTGITLFVDGGVHLTGLPLNRIPGD
jgi:NAD(P)-dependent dehydrogenase (short-subunit alcohol dehydrogenase family)